MEKEQDLVKVPAEWLPINAIDLFSSGNFKSLQSANFFTDDLKMNGETFYINKDGYLMHEDRRMSVVVGEPEINDGKVCLVVDTSHRPVMEHKLRKLYSVVWDKMCILVLQFKESRVVEAQSIIRHVHNR
jgi:hypothetical protein